MAYGPMDHPQPQCRHRGTPRWALRERRGGVNQARVLSVPHSVPAFKRVQPSKNQTKPKDYVLHPGGLVYRGRVSYLVGSFEGNPENIIYLPLHRFKKVSVLDDFSVHENEDIKNLTEGLLGFKVNPNKINVELKFSKFAGTHLYESPLSDTQKIISTKDGFLKVKDAVIDDMELRFWIRGFGDEVEVLKPKSLRQEFASMSKLMNKKYENN